MSEAGYSNLTSISIIYSYISIGLKNICVHDCNCVRLDYTRTTPVSLR